MTQHVFLFNFILYNANHYILLFPCCKKKEKTMTKEEKGNRQVCFACPIELHDWLKEKGEVEVRTLSNSIIHIIQSAKANS